MYEQEVKFLGTLYAHVVLSNRLIFF